jgi:hypothetical protein
MQPPAGQMRGQHEEPRSAPRAARLSRVFRQGFRLRRRQPGACDPGSGCLQYLAGPLAVRDPAPWPSGPSRLCAFGW